MIGRSTKVLINDEIVPLTEEIKHQLQHQNEEFSKRALRVLAFAYRPLTVSEDEELHLGLEEELIFVGLMAMIDPLGRKSSKPWQTRNRLASKQ